MALSLCPSQPGGGCSEGKQENKSQVQREPAMHGTLEFPLAIYEDDICAEEVVWHWHEEFEAGIIMEGSVLIESGSRKYLLREGDGFFINSGVIHAVKNGEAPRPSALRSLVFHRSMVGGASGSIFDNEYVVPVLHNRDFPEYILRKARREDIDMLGQISKAWEAVFWEEPGYALEARNQLSQLLARLQQECPLSGSCKSKDLVREKRTREMLSFIHDNYGEDISLSDIAGQASVSPTEALRCFHQIVGDSPMQYLKKYRLLRAAQMIRNQGEPISFIASLCGFQDHSYFTRSFREAYGCSPRDYRLERQLTDKNSGGNTDE